MAIVLPNWAAMLLLFVGCMLAAGFCNLLARYPASLRIHKYTVNLGEVLISMGVFYLNMAWLPGFLPFGVTLLLAAVLTFAILHMDTPLASVNLHYDRKPPQSSGPIVDPTSTHERSWL